jgi:hypothetical protein
MTRRTLLTALSLIMPAVLQAQVAGEVSASKWLLEDARGSFCIWYLTDPAVAPKLAPKGTTLAPAGTGAELPAAVVRVIRDEPQFAAWIPAMICVGRYGAVTVDGETAVRARADRSILLMTHAIAAAAPRGQSGAAWYLLELSTDNGNVARLAEGVGIRTERRELDVLPAREGGDAIMTIQVEKAKLIWSGHPTGESRVEATQPMSFGLAGMRTSNWRLDASFTPDSSHLVVGQLRVEGKDDLAKALKASPIRWVGPIVAGGRGEWLFTRGGGR